MHQLVKHITKPTSIAPLAAFRILFGAVMFISMIRFLLKGWVAQLYLEPTYFFTYYGFEWISPAGPFLMYVIFGVIAIAALGIMSGWKYKWSAIIFFIGFNYIELLDKSNYLNHYYFISLMSFLLILVPANRKYSIDVLKDTATIRDKVPAWCINIFKLQLGIVYFYAGLAKLNYDWLVHAMPLKIWLPAHAQMPVIGDLLTQEWVAYAFSWGGAVYDLTIPFLLLIPATRVGAFGMVVIFHLITRLLFPIGMFPYIMILSTLIFFSANWHERNFKWISQLFNWQPNITSNIKYAWQNPAKKVIAMMLTVFFVLQLLIPFRHHLYSGNLFWTEQGYRFGWRVMLAEKAGHATFYIKDPETNNEAQVDLSKYLQPHQEKQMSFQPDMILQFAHFLDKEYQRLGINDPEVRAHVYVTLNGRQSKLLIDPEIDLSNNLLIC